MFFLGLEKGGAKRGARGKHIAPGTLSYRDSAAPAIWRQGLRLIRLLCLIGLLSLIRHPRLFGLFIFRLVGHSAGSATACGRPESGTFTHGHTNSAQ